MCEATSTRALARSVRSSPHRCVPMARRRTACSDSVRQLSYAQGQLHLHSAYVVARNEFSSSQSNHNFPDWVSTGTGVLVPLAVGVSAAPPAEGEVSASAASDPPPFSSNASM